MAQTAEEKAEKARERAAARRAEEQTNRAEESARLRGEELARINELGKTDPAAAEEAMTIFQARERDAQMAALNQPPPEEEFVDPNDDGGGEITDFADVTPGGDATQTFVIQDPNLMRQVQGAQARAKGMSDRLDYAPNGGVFLRSDGSGYVNFDGLACDENGKITRE